MFYDLAKINLLNNGCESVRLSPYALGDKRTTIKVPRPTDSNFGSFSISVRPPGGVNSSPNVDDVKIDVVNLDSLNLKDVSIIKLDVEGYELRVLKGGMKTIRKNRPTIFIEIHRPFYEEYLKSPEFKALFKLGYRLAKIREGRDDYILY